MAHVVCRLGTLLCSNDLPVSGVHTHVQLDCMPAHSSQDDTLCAGICIAQHMHLV